MKKTSRSKTPEFGASSPLLLSLLIVALLGACQGEVSSDVDGEAAAGKGGELVFATSVAAPSLHPYEEISDARMRRSHLMYDTLVEWNDELQPSPGLAEDWELGEDEWTFHLREGVTFQNGQPLTADDVVYSLKQVLKSPGAAFYSAIEDVEAVDELTVRLQVSDASGPLLAALGGRYAFIVPKGADKEYNLDTEAVGTGVFKVTEFRQGQFLRLEKNPDHWRAEDVSLDELTIQIVEDESAIVAGLRGGTIDAAIFEDAHTAELLSGEEGITVTEDEGVRWDVLDFPLDVEPFSIPEFRQAIATAIDREAIMQLAIDGRGTILGGHPPALWGALPPEEAPFVERDLDRAKDLLAESGVEDTNLTLTSIQGYGALNSAAEVIADNLSEIGLNVTIKREDLGVWIDKFTTGKFDTFTMNSWGGFVDPDLLYYNHFHKDAADFRGWNHEEISTLISEGRQMINQEEREPIYEQVQEVIVEDVPLVPLYSANFLGAHRNTVSNWSVHPSGYYHNLRWLAIGE